MRNIKTYEGLFSKLFGKNKEEKNKGGVVPPAYKPNKKSPSINKVEDTEKEEEKPNTKARKHMMKDKVVKSKLKHLNRFNESVTFPTLEDVESASPEQIMQWQRFLSPKNMDEVKIVNDVFDRYKKLKSSGDINSSTSKNVGW